MDDAIAEQPIKTRVEAVLNGISGALERSGRQGERVTLVAVSKGQSAEAMREVGTLLAQQGWPVVFGESYVQEFRAKQALLTKEFSSSWRCHLIGVLQRNKAREALRMFDCVQSVDSLALAAALEKEAVKSNVRREILLQVNVSHDGAKHGVLPSEVAQLMQQVHADCPHLALCGVMAITKFYEHSEDVRADYKQMKVLAIALERDPATSAALVGGVCQVSMGMSGDYEIAVEEGATMVRVGTAIFGERG